jgi:hypothetical protein
MINISAPKVKNFLIELEEIFEHEKTDKKRVGPFLNPNQGDFLIAD